MKKIVKNIMTSFMIVSVMFIGALMLSPTVTYAEIDPSTGLEGGINLATDGRDSDLGAFFTNGINTALFILGALSVVMMIFGGIRYTISGGDSTAVTAAKNTILYAVIGLVVALLSFSISNFVIGAF